MFTAIINNFQSPKIGMLLFIFLRLNPLHLLNVVVFWYHIPRPIAVFCRIWNILFNDI